MSEGGGIELATAYVQLVPSLKGMESHLASEFGMVTGAASAAGVSSGGGFMSGLKKAIVPAAIIGTTVMAFKGLYEVGKTFDAITDTIRTGTGAQGKALEGLVDVAKSVGNNVPAEFSKIGPTVADLNTRLGLSGKTLETVSSQYLEAGRILKQDVDIQKTTAAFNAFGIEGDAVSGAMDDLFRVSQATGVGMNELAGSVQSMAPALKNLGFSFADSAALAGSLDKAGLNTQQMLAAMSKGMVTLAKAGEDPAAAFRRVTGELDGLIKAGDTAGAIDLASGIFGTRGAAQFVGAVQSGTLAMDDLMAATGATGDTILGVADETRSFSESFKILKNNAMTALEPLSSAVFGTLSEVMKTLAESFKTLAPTIGAALDALSPVLTSAIGPAFDIISQLLTALVPLIPALAPVIDAFMSLAQVIGGAMASAMPPIIDLVTVLANALSGALGAALPTITSLVTTLADIFTQVLAAALPSITALLDVVGQVMQTLAPHIKTVADTIGQALSGALGQILPVLGDLITKLLDALMPVLPKIADLIGKLAERFAGFFASALETLLPPLLKIITALVEALVPVLPKLMDLVMKVADIFSGTLMSAMETLLPIVAELITKLADALVPILPMLADLIGQMSDIVMSLFTAIEPLIPVLVDVLAKGMDPLMKIIELLLPVITKLADLLSGTLSLAFNGVKLAIDGVGSVLTWLMDHAVKPVQSAFEAMGKGVGDVFNGLVSTVKGPINGIISLVNKMIDGINGINFDIPDFVPIIGGKHVGFNLPHIPQLADGGIVQPKPGGTLAMIAEAGQPEVVIPLSKLNSMIAGIHQNPAPTSEGLTVNQTNNFNQPLDERVLASSVIRRIDDAVRMGV